MTTFAQPASFNIGRVLSRLFGVLGRNFLVFAGLSLLLVGVPTIALGLFNIVRFTANPVTSFSLDQAFAPLNIAIIVMSMVIVVAANFVLQGAIIHGTVSDLAGRRALFGECLGTGIRFLFPLIGIGIVSTIAVAFASLLLFVPGVMLGLAWSVAAPAEVTERTGVLGAFRRSLVLTRNCRLAIFGLAVIYGVVLFCLQLVLSPLQGAITAAFMGRSLQNMQTLLAVHTAINVLTQTLTALVSSVGVASVYFELRSIKDGVGADQLAAVFD